MKTDTDERAISRAAGTTVLPLLLGFAALFAPNLSAQESGTSPGETVDFEAAIFGVSESATDAVTETPSGADLAATIADFDAEAAAGEKARTDYLVGGTVIVRAAAAINIEEESYTAVSNADGKLFAKVTVPDYGALYASMTAAYPFFQGYAGDGPPPPASDTAAPEIALSELHYSFDVSKRVFARLGNQLISWGPSRIWSPVDFINREKEDALAPLDSRAGKNGFRIHVPFSHANAFLFSDFSGMTADGKFGDPGSTVNTGGRIDAAAGGFEFGLTGYGGRNSRARAGFDFSGRIFGMTAYGEFAYDPAYADWDSGVQVSLGFSRTLGELKRWTVAGEAFYNSYGKDLSDLTDEEFATLSADERVPLYMGRAYAYGSIAADKLFLPYLSADASALANLQDRSYRLKTSATLAFPRAVPFTLAVAFAGGERNAEFTRNAGNALLNLTLSTTIEF